MFKLQPNPTFSAKVEIPVPGADAPATLPLVFRHKGRKAAQAWVESAPGRQDIDFLMEIVADWGAEVVGEDGQPQAFSREAFDRLLDEYPASGQAIFNAYLRELGEARRGN